MPVPLLDGALAFVALGALVLVSGLALPVVPPRLRGPRMALDEVDLRPEHVPEGIARDKLIEELLDRVVERGFLQIGDLRDAIARNRLKLPDLAGPATFFTGDRLICRSAIPKSSWNKGNLAAPLPRRSAMNFFRRAAAKRCLTPASVMPRSIACDAGV